MNQRYFRQKHFASAIAIIALATFANSASAAVVLYATSYEDSGYAVGDLSGQNGWANSFGVDATVNSGLARTGSQSLEIRQLAGQDPFGLTTRVGPYSTSLPQVSVEQSIYLAGTTGWNSPATFLSPISLGGDNGFIAQLPVRNGAHVRFGNTELPIVPETWIDLKLVLDFPTQTASAFVNGSHIGSQPFENAATQLSQVELWHVFDNTDFESPGPSNSFFVDDLRITAVPEPGSGLLLAGAGIVAFTFRRLWANQRGQRRSGVEKGRGEIPGPS